ncbi:M14 family metallopeptidase [Biformimicrobium ophioploci]|uniref:M14 family metallopeptidase n=1 Tax=Biformimicrobium ophioploci TaxID=3036711 RepID=A0ABQ6LVQ4_9GAMM|nr:M14 family metallopeptidase [Microbulbifer sp. NKW57]
MAPFSIAGHNVWPGERLAFDLEVAQLYTHAPLSIPVEVLHGRKPGPVLLVNAAIHGDELNGVEVVRQLLARLQPHKIKGTLVAVPVVNVFGFVHKSRYLPDRRDLNRSFPGSEGGSIAARMAYQFFTEIVQHCTHVIDLHTGAIHRDNLPQIRADLSTEATREMAEAFGAPVVIDAVLRDGSLRAEAEQADIPVLTYEGGEALRFDKFAIAGGVHGVINVMRNLGMMPASRRKARSEPVIARSSSWVRANSNGILLSKVRLGDRVKRGQLLAEISAPLGADVTEVFAHRDGIVIGMHTLPLVNEGDALMHLAYFSSGATRHVEEQVEVFRDEVSDLEMH